MTSRAELIGWVNDLLQLNYTKASRGLVTLLAADPWLALCRSSSAVAVRHDVPRPDPRLTLLADPSQAEPTRRSSTRSIVSPFSCPPLRRLLISSRCAEDVPMSKIKMNANQEYEYINNFKVLQTIFKRHSIDKVRPSLVVSTAC